MSEEETQQGGEAETPSGKRLRVEPRASANKKSASNFKVNQVGAGSPKEDRQPVNPLADQIIKKTDDEEMHSEAATSEQAFASTNQRHEAAVAPVVNPHSKRWMVISAAVVFLLLLVALTVGLLQRRASDSTTSISGLEQGLPKSPSAAQPTLFVPPILRSKPVTNELIEEVGDILDRRAEAKQLVEGLSEVGSFSGIRPQILRPEEFDSFQGEKNEEPFGWSVEKAAWNALQSNGVPFGVFQGNDSNFEPFTIFFRKVGGKLKFDWKATTAWSSTSFQNLSEGKGDSSEIRASVRTASFYNIHFPEDDYRSYLIGSPHSEEAIWGYVANDSIADRVLRSQQMIKAGSDVTLKLGKGRPELRENQWMIEEVLRLDWLTELTTEEN